MSSTLSSSGATFASFRNSCLSHLTSADVPWTDSSSLWLALSLSLSLAWAFLPLVGGVCFFSLGFFGQLRARWPCRLQVKQRPCWRWVSGSSVVVALARDIF